MARILKALFFLFLLLLGIELYIKNPQPVSFNYYLGSIETPMALLIAAALLLGAVMGIVVNLGVVIRLQRRVAELRSTLKSAQRKSADNPPRAPVKDGP
ncbi:MAG: lipopolysaccharide assembly protein LapA domain-containing protein [Gammaproteobacteria bacterium]